MKEKKGDFVATIKDIARLSGCSPATVSRVINQSGYASEESRKKVEAAIKQLEYIPNKHAVSLKSGATKTLGIVTTMYTTPVSMLINAFILIAEEKGYAVTVFNTNNDPKQEIKAYNMLRNKQLDGIFTIYRTNDWEVLFHYEAYGPIVTLQRIEDERIPSVYVDHYEMYREALEFLWMTGCRNIINVYGLERGRNTQMRIRAYHDFCQAHNIQEHPSTQFIDCGSIEDGKEIGAWFHQQIEKPDAFLVQTDLIAAGLVYALRKEGYRLPIDVSVMGFDNLEMSELMEITTVDYQITRQARNAFRLLYNQLQTKEQLPLEEIESRMIERETTKKVKIESD